ncbi:hypothetical protein JCM14036_22970 [Desulfotomaculum defluvii]
MLSLIYAGSGDYSKDSYDINKAAEHIAKITSEKKDKERE